MPPTTLPFKICRIAGLTLTALVLSPAVHVHAKAPVQAKAASTQADVSASDILQTPVTDLNIKQGEIPRPLLNALANPYGLSGLTTCTRLASAVNALDAVLGDDVDSKATPNRLPQPGRMAQSVVGSFIPFRGIIREVSGASAQQRRLQRAILAGTARRGFLKGIGQQRGCHYPARPFRSAPQK
jgi:hypothetical protein